MNDNLLKMHETDPVGIETPVEKEAQNVIITRKTEAAQLQEQGKTLSELLTHFDNDYTPLDKAYQEKVGVPLNTDPFEAAKHPIPIAKTCSIVIPAYNAGQQFVNTLKAIKESTFNAKYPQQLEVVVIDDGSPKVDIASLVRDMGLEDLTVRVYRQSNGRENKGRYSGVLNAKGEVIIFTAQDTVYSPTMIEEYMKRHEVLDDVVCFGFREEIDTNDPRLDRIEQGGLYELPYDFQDDGRIAEDGMTETDWLKKAGHNQPIPMNAANDNFYGWKPQSLAWGFTVSAKRDQLLKTFAGHDERYKGYGGDDEHMVADLMAEGLYVIPNTGGIAYHERHSSRWDPEEAQINVKVLQEYRNSPVRRQNIDNPLQTDAQLAFEQVNSRTEQKPARLPQASDSERLPILINMGLYQEAVKLANSIEQEQGEDPWFLYNQALALTKMGGYHNWEMAVQNLLAADLKEPSNPNILAALGNARAKAGNYEGALVSYQKVLEMEPDHEEVQYLVMDAESPAESIDQKYQLAQKLMQRGKNDQAVRYLEGIICLKGEAHSSWQLFDKAVAFSRMGLPSEAIDILQTLKDRNQFDNTWINCRLGMIYEQIGQKGEAVAAYEAAIAQDNTNSEAHEGLQRLKS